MLFPASGTAWCESPPTEQHWTDPELPPPSSRQDIRVGLSLYGWLPSFSGDVIGRGVGVDVDITGDQLLEGLDSAFFFHSEVRWRRLIASFDDSWVRVSACESGRLVDVEAKVNRRQLEFRLGYEAVRALLDDEPSTSRFGPREFVMDVYAGARFTRTTIETSTRILGSTPLQVNSTTERWDPIVGLRMSYDLTSRWMAFGRGDIGGFGIGAAAEFTWLGEIGVGFRLAPEVMIAGGYRALGVDTLSGSGGGRNGVDYVQHGPFVGLALTF